MWVFLFTGLSGGYHSIHFGRGVDRMGCVDRGMWIGDGVDRGVCVGLGCVGRGCGQRRMYGKECALPHTGPPETATEADGTYLTGMHTCYCSWLSSEGFGYWLLLHTWSILSWRSLYYQYHCGLLVWWIYCWKSPLWWVWLGSRLYTC